MKYVLKKDLPFAEKGATVRISCNHPMISMSFQTLNDEKIIDINLQCEEQIAILVAMGWIEEVKPRVWWEVEYKKEDGSWSHLGIRYGNPDAAHHAAMEFKGKGRYIKVCEVIE